jgi:hypothetical protein
MRLLHRLAVCRDVRSLHQFMVCHCGIERPASGYPTDQSALQTNVTYGAICERIYRTLNGGKGR